MFSRTTKARSSFKHQDALFKLYASIRFVAEIHHDFGFCNVCYTYYRYRTVWKLFCLIWFLGSGGFLLRAQSIPSSSLVYCVYERKHVSLPVSSIARIYLHKIYIIEVVIEQTNSSQIRCMFKYCIHPLFRSRSARKSAIVRSSECLWMSDLSAFHVLLLLPLPSGTFCALEHIIIYFMETLEIAGWRDTKELQMSSRPHLWYSKKLWSTSFVKRPKYSFKIAEHSTIKNRLLRQTLRLVQTNKPRCSRQLFPF